MTSLSKEQQILVVMRKVLGAIIRDTTPPRGCSTPYLSLRSRTCVSVWP